MTLFNFHFALIPSLSQFLVFYNYLKLQNPDLKYFLFFKFFFSSQNFNCRVILNFNPQHFHRLQSALKEYKSTQNTHPILSLSKSIFIPHWPVAPQNSDSPRHSCTILFPVSAGQHLFCFFLFYYSVLSILMDCFTFLAFYNCFNNSANKHCMMNI